MSDAFETRLGEHFKSVDARHAATAAAGQTAAEKEKEFHLRFTKAINEVIQPAMEKLRDLLLARNCPAEILKDTDRIALNCSNNINDYRTVAVSPMFQITFYTAKNKTGFRASHLMIQGAPEKGADVPIRLGDITKENVEKVLFDFVAACYPR